MKKTIYAIIIVIAITMLTSCSLQTDNKNDNVKTNSSNINSDSTFDEAKAISLIIKDNPDFPSNSSDTLTKELPIGGPQGATADVKFTTKIDKIDETTYSATLTKDWGITVGGDYAKSYWKYLVTPKGVSQSESCDKDYLIDAMD